MIFKRNFRQQKLNLFLSRKEEHPFKKAKCAFGKHLEYQKTILKDALDLVKNLRVGSRKKLMDWQQNFVLTCNSLPQLFDELREHYPDITYILTSRLLQDALENLFGRLRHLAGNDKSFGSLGFRRLLRSLILGAGDDIPISGHS